MPPTDSSRARLRIPLTFAALLALAIILTLVATTASEGQPAAVEAQATASRTTSAHLFTALAESTEVQTAATEFEDVPGFSTTIRLGGSARACVTVAFSGEMTRGGPTGEVLVFRALVDGQLMEGHNPFGYVVHYPAASLYELSSYTFWKCGIPSGTHTLALQWRSGGGNTIALRGRTLVIEGR